MKSILHKQLVLSFQLSIRIDFDECSSADSNDCDSNAQCTNVEGSYHCVCGAGYTDVSDKYYLLRGRVCEGRGTTTTTSK